MSPDQIIDPELDPTAAQRVASNPQVSSWVSASAGTGKTRVLTDRVLRLMLAGAAPGKILCLTFTKAAAAEMANRLNSRLAEWAMMDDQKLSASLFDLSGQEPDGEIRAVARGLFARVLDVPGGLKIQTIHAFCQSLLGRFPLEAGLAPHFKVMDERTAAEMQREARDAMLRAARQDPALSDALMLVTAQSNEDDFGKLLSSLASERRRLAQLFSVTGGLEQSVTRVRQHLGLENTETRDSILQAACDQSAFDFDGLMGASEALKQGSKTDVARSEILTNWLKEAASRVDDFGAYSTLYVTQKGQKRAKMSTKSVQNVLPEIDDILIQEADRVIGILERLTALAIAEATAALLALGAAMLAFYDQIKRQNVRLDYDDLVLLTRDLLSRSDAAAWVLYKLDEGLDHVLVDEAQDTNPDQWAVIAALVSEFFTGEGARQINRTMFAVGDVKQSIYGFQRADPANFVTWKTRFGKTVLDVDRLWRPVNLAVSFRSTQAVLDVVDDVFGSEATRNGLVFGEGEVKHFSHRNGQAGRVELWPALQPPETDQEEEWALPVKQYQVLSASHRLALDIANRIRNWIDSGEILESRARGIRPGDIMVLVQRRTDFVTDLVSALKTLGVAVAGTDRMVLADQLPVKDLMAVARFVLLPEDDLTCAEVLKGPFCNLDDDDLFALAHERQGTLWHELQTRVSENQDWQAAEAFLATLMGRADFVPPYEFFARLLGAMGGRRRLLARLGSEINDPVDEFLALAQTYEQNRVPSLQGFLHWLAAGESEVKRDPELLRDEVRVMTVHGAKGLQAPVVILPDTIRVPRKDDPLMWAPANDGTAELHLLLWPGKAGANEPVTRELREAARERRDQEYRRLLYVALTRAEDRLYVGGWDTRNKRQAGCWYDLVEQAMQHQGVSVEVEQGTVWVHHGDQHEAPDSLEDEKAAAKPVSALPIWAGTTAPPEPTPPRPLAPSRPDGEEPPVRSPLAEDDMSRFQRGRLIHRLLQTLPDLPESARAEAANRFLENPAHRLEPENREKIATEALDILQHPEFAAIFGPDSRAEVAIAGVLGEHVISGQVDRLLVEADQILVIDYKTNRPPPTSEATVSPVYLRQMAVYRAALQQIYPEKSVRCALLWTDIGHLMTLSDQALDDYALDTQI
ncbi:MAG: double-strand break repair helicase AddA [Alphaproteobacteria bacterium]|nr:double-strand break repair helicase AddA [Alphaproteobacteria bacterium]MBT4085614.1 double-strand break repair helicase AddA [Alphaproteobacteria bacterium]MBT4544461.1 double-strand break repair helicase AddA [Alphaproteobacteria bacterium]MBT6385822.1 double-strand break repair helicase AddA [Alphaproteobacteria bacterium]MBT7746236.1 double-strand break repair helicase AddA [Alphaproteobacteria bacterium]